MLNAECNWPPSRDGTIARINRNSSVGRNGEVSYRAAQAGNVEVILFPGLLNCEQFGGKKISFFWRPFRKKGSQAVVKCKGPHSYCRFALHNHIIDERVFRTEGTMNGQHWTSTPTETVVNVFGTQVIEKDV
jgi:hypothetical protein